MKIRSALLITPGIFLFHLLSAQDNDTIQTWKYEGRSSLSFSQISLQHWAAGGDESVSGIGVVNVSARYRRDSTLVWENLLDVNYGLQKVNDQSPSKTDDLLEVSSKFGRRAAGKWFYSALLSFQTQMQEGFQEGDTTGLPSSRFMAPAYVLVSLGIDYNPNDKFTLLLSPATSKITVVNDERLANRGAFGVDSGEKVRYEIGGYVKTRYTVTVFENVDVLLKLNLFSNYIEKPENVDVDSEINISMQINNFLSATVKTNLKYDHDITFINSEGKEVNSYLQFKEILGITLTYKFL